MQTFRIAKSVRNSWIYWPVIILVSIATVIGDIWSRVQQSGFVAGGAALMCGLLGGVTLVAYVATRLYSATVYLASDAELVKRTAIGETRMPWREVEKISGGEIKSAQVTLTDHRGRKMTIAFGSLENRGEALRALLQTQLQRLLAHEKAEFAAKPSTGRSNSQSAGVLLICFGVLFVVGSVLLIAFRRGDSGIVPLAVMLGILGLVIGLLGLYAATRYVTLVQNELICKTMLGEKRIRLSDVHSVFTYEGSGKAGPYELLTVRDRSNKIVLASQSVRDYGLLRDRLIAGVPAEALQRGDGDRTTYDVQQERTGIGIITVCTLMLAGMGIWMLSTAMQKAQYARVLQEHGVYTTATVVGDACSCANGGLSDIRYTFRAQGRDFTKLNHTTAATRSIQVGDRVPICYLPEDPDHSLLKVRLDWRPIIANGVFPISFMLASPLLIPVARRRLRQKETRQQ